MLGIKSSVTLVLATSIVFLFAAPARGQQTLLDDFSSGTDASWTREDQLFKNGLGVTTYQVTGGEYRISGTVPALPIQIGTGSWYTASMTTPSLYSDGVFEATVRAEGNNNVILLIRGDAQLNGYLLTIQEAYDTVSIERIDLGQSAKVIATASFVVNQFHNYRVKGTFLGGEFSMKIWDPAVASEPALPQLAGTETTYATGWLGVGVASYTSTLCVMGGVFDDIYFTPCGSVTSYGTGCVGSGGKTPALTITGCVSKGETFTLGISDGVPNTYALLFAGASQAALPVGAGCVFGIKPPFVVGSVPIDGTGSLVLPVTIPLTVPSGTVDMQAWVIDPPAPLGASGTNGLEVEIP